MKAEYRSAKRRRIAAEKADSKKSLNEKNSSSDNNDNDDESDDNNITTSSEPFSKAPKFYEIKEGEEFNGPNVNKLDFCQNTRCVIKITYLNSECIYLK